jgi:hypothetical protein
MEISTRATFNMSFHTIAVIYLIRYLRNTQTILAPTMMTQTLQTMALAIVDRVNIYLTLVYGRGCSILENMKTK